MDVRDIALLFGVPLRRDEFEQRAAASDWLRKYYDEHADETECTRQLQTAWERDYRPWIAEPFLALQERASRLGVEIRTGATLGTLQIATAQSAVVVVVSHWKGPEVANGDFIEPVVEASFLARARRSNTTLGRWLCPRFEALGTATGRRQSFWRSLFGTRRTETLRGVVRQAVNAEVEEDDPSAEGVDEVHEHPASRAAWRRETLDKIFDGLLRPGNRLELFDGLYSKEAVEAAISPHFEGMLDLTVCTSAFLADFISNQRQLRLRTTQFPTDQEPSWAAKHLEWTFELIAEQGLTYLEARELAGRTLKQAVVEATL